MAKILLIDDEEDILVSIKMLLETMGHQTKTANNGQNAVETLKKEKFDLVLLDMLMPEMSGTKVLQKIRADPKTKNQKVAFLTVIEPSKTGQELIKKLKPIEYFQKPINNRDFKKRIKKILE